MFNRATHIALRASRTAHRLASDVLHPPLAKPPERVLPLSAEAPEPQAPVVPVDEILAKANADSPGRRWTRAVILILVQIAFWIAVLLALHAVLK